MSFACLIPILLLCFIAGFFVIRSGRGTPALSEPRCAKCKYDLRGFVGSAPTRCSECGADLTLPHAILWGTYARKPRRTWIGIAVMLSPFLLFPLLILVFRTGMLHVGGSNSPGSPGFMSRSNAQVIASLSTSANAPWDWQELQRRLANGSLSKAEVAQSIDQLIAFLNTQPTNQPLSWSDQYLNAADTAGDISDEQFGRLARAFYKPIKVSIAAKTRAGAKLDFTVGGSASWQLGGCDYVYALRQVAVTGGGNLEIASERNPNPKKPNADYLSANAPFDIAGQTNVNLPAGNYSLVFTIDVAVLRKSTAPQMVNGLPGQAVNWPKGRAAWTETVTVPMTVVATDQSPIGLVTDPKLDPQTTGAIKINEIRVIRKGTGQRVTVDLAIDGKTCSTSFDFSLRVAGKEYPLGYLVNWWNNSSGTELATDFDSLDPSVKTADVLLRPNAKHAEGLAGIDHIWGKPIDLLNIPLARYDLQGK